MNPSKGNNQNSLLGPFFLVKTFRNRLRYTVSRRVNYLTYVPRGTVLGCKLCTMLAKTACCLAGALAAQSIRLPQVGEFSYQSLSSVAPPFAFLSLCLRPQFRVPSKNFAAKSSREDKVYQEGVCLCE